MTHYRLFDTAIGLMAKRGYAATTLRDVAAEAGVSPTLLYRYFPSKQSVVLALYDDLSARYAAAAAEMPRGRWRALSLRLTSAKGLCSWMPTAPT